MNIGWVKYNIFLSMTGLYALGILQIELPRSHRHFVN